jgi:hypothetical protein
MHAQTEESKSVLDAAVRRRLLQWSIQIRSASDAIESIGRELDSLGIPQGGAVARLATERVNRFATYLESTDLLALMADARTFTREHPAIVFASAFGVGMAAARIVRAR